MPSRTAIRSAACAIAFVLPLAATPKPIDAARSVITLRVYRGGFFSFAGDNHEIAARITAGTVDESALAVTLTVDPAQMQVLDPGLAADQRAQVQQRMLGADVLDVTRYPVIEFHSQSVSAAGPGRWRVAGLLTLHGVTQPVTLEVDYTAGAYVGTTSLRQTRFGIHPITVAGGAVKVKDEVKITFQIFTR